MDIEFTDQIDVQLIDCLAGDTMVCNAARVSTQGVDTILNSEGRAGMINFLMKNRHGTPFEHNQFIFFIDAPIFVFREFHRHRIGWSYNEESGRYKELRGKFYIPSRDRNLIQVGKPGHYTYESGTPEMYNLVAGSLKRACHMAYDEYRFMLSQGVAKEVARMCLPVETYSSMYATCNARSLMAFLSLRQKHTQREPKVDVEFTGHDDSRVRTHIRWEGEAMFPSFPMHEINVVADKMEAFFVEAMPWTHDAFVKNGYVAP